MALEQNMGGWVSDGQLSEQELSELTPEERYRTKVGYSKMRGCGSMGE